MHDNGTISVGTRDRSSESFLSFSELTVVAAADHFLSFFLPFFLSFSAFVHVLFLTLVVYLIVALLVSFSSVVIAQVCISFSFASSHPRVPLTSPLVLRHFDSSPLLGSVSRQK
jgi:hypothetical protein